MIILQGDYILSNKVFGIKGYVAQIGYGIYNNEDLTPALNKFEVIGRSDASFFGSDTANARYSVKHNFEYLSGYKKTRSRVLEIGSLVSMRVKRGKPFHNRVNLVSIRVSDYKAKRGTSKNGTEFVYGGYEQTLAAFVNKECFFDLKAIEHHDEELYDIFLNFTDTDMENLKKDARDWKGTSYFKYGQDIQGFCQAVDKELRHRNTAWI